MTFSNPGLRNILTSLIYWVTQKKWLLIAIIMGIVLYQFSVPEGLTQNGYNSLIIVAITIVLIIFEPIPLPGIAIFILVFQVVLGIASANTVASSFMSDAVFFIMGSLMLAVAIVSQGLDTRLALAIIRITGNKTWRIVLGFIGISAVLSSFIGEHTVTALMMPAGLTLVKYAESDLKKNRTLAALILFSIEYGSAIGSIGSPSGGGRNAIIINYWSQMGLSEITYLKWIIHAYPIVLIEIPLAALILWFTFRPRKKNLDTAVRKLVVQVANQGSMSAREYLAIGVFIFIFFCWVFLSPAYGLGIIALFGVLLYLVFGLVDWDIVSRNTNWGVIVLFGAAISLGTQMKETGAAFWVADSIITFVEGFPLPIENSGWFVSVALTGIMTNLLSSAATVAVLGPIVLNMPGDPIILGMTTAVASGFSYLTVVASPTCMIIHSTGLVKSSDYLKAGWKMFLMSVVVLFLASVFYWPTV